MLAADGKAVLAQQVPQHARAGERMLQMQFVDAAHHRQVFLRSRLGPVIER